MSASRDPTSLPAELWVAFVQSPDGVNFAALYEATNRLVWTLCARILGDPQEAEDAFQSVWCRLLGAVRDGAVAAEAADPPASLYRLTIREADRLRKRRSRRRARWRPLPQESEVLERRPAVDELVARAEIRERVVKLVDELPEAARLAVQLHYFHGLSQRQVARALGLPLSTVADRIGRALRRLDPACRRLGLGEASATLGACVVSAALLEPTLSAAEVFTRASATLAATAGGVMTPSTSATTAVLGGLLSLMKAKSTIFAVAASILLVILLVPAVVSRFKDTDGDAPSPIAEAPPATAPLEQASPATAPATAAVETPASPTPRDAATPDTATAATEEGTISGLVSDAITGEPIPGAVVRIGRRKTVEKAVSNADGVYRLAGLANGVHELVAVAAGYADQAAQVTLAAPTVTGAAKDFALDLAYEVDVLVVDGDGVAVPGAGVVPSMLGVGDGAFYLDEALTTDGDGRAVIAGISRLRPRQIKAFKKGYRASHGRPVPDASAESVELELILESKHAATRVIVGRVTGAIDGRPIADALIEWKDGESTSFGDGAEYGQFNILSRTDGTYRLEFEDDYDVCHLGVAASGWAPQVARDVRPGTRAEPLRRDFALEPGHWLAGRVIDEDGTPLAGVVISAMPRRDLLNAAVAYPAVLRRAETDADGRFRLEDLAGPTVALHLWPADRRPAQEDVVDVDGEIELVFEGWGTISGRVVDAATGHPVEHFNVRLSGDSLESGRAFQGETFTTTDGRFALERLHRNDDWTIIVSADGFLPGTVEGIEARPQAEAEDVRVALESGTALEGIVVDPLDGAPLAGVRVVCTAYKFARQLLTLDWQELRRLRFPVPVDLAVTGDDGVFAFREGDTAATLMFAAAGRRRLYLPPTERSAHIGFDGKLRIALSAGEHVGGVYYVEGRPAAGVEIRLYELADPTAPFAGGQTAEIGVTTTDAAGRFGWDDLQPGFCLLQALCTLDDPWPGFAIRIRRRLEVVAGEAQQIDLGRDLGPFTWRGAITGMESNDARAAHVTLRPIDASGAVDGVTEIAFSTYRESGFRFACPGLRRGKYAVTLTYWDSGSSQNVTLEPVEIANDIELNLSLDDAPN